MVSTADPLSITAADLRVRRLGEPSFLSPMAGLVQGRVSSPHYVHEADRVLLDDTLVGAAARLCGVAELPSLEPGGPREYLYFDPAQHPGRDRHLRRPVPRAEQRDPRPGPRARRQLRGHRGARLPRRLPRHGRARPAAGPAEPRRGRRHPQPGRHHPRHLPRQPGPGPDGGDPGAARRLPAVRDRRGRHAARRGEDRRRGGRARPARCRSSACPRRSTTTSPTSTRASASRPRSPGPPTRSSPPIPRPAPPRTASAWSR